LTICLSQFKSAGEIGIQATLTTCVLRFFCVTLPRLYVPVNVQLVGEAGVLIVSVLVVSGLVMMLDSLVVPSVSVQPPVMLSSIRTPYAPDAPTSVQVAVTGVPGSTDTADKLLVIVSVPSIDCRLIFKPRFKCPENIINRTNMPPAIQYTFGGMFIAIVLPRSHLLPAATLQCGGG